ncbi:MAG: hypothetical protein NVS3B21_27110 [Acidimicrobiales bacterium]
MGLRGGRADLSWIGLGTPGASCETSAPNGDTLEAPDPRGMQTPKTRGVSTARATVAGVDLSRAFVVALEVPTGGAWLGIGTDLHRRKRARAARWDGARV